MQRLKVVIADDEARVCRLIQLLPDWEGLGMEVVGTASDGLAALDTVRRCQPHILITDMRMPGCHGLELIERVKSEFPRLEIIIISGYAHFEYAQSAIKFGVGDYLLKPIQKDELTATLEKLGRNCRQHMVENRAIEQLKLYTEESVVRLRMQLIRDLDAQKLTRPTAQQLWEHYHLRLQEGLIQTFALKIDYPVGSITEQTLDLMRQKAEQAFMMALSPLCPEMALVLQPPWACGILNFPPGNRERVRRALRDCLNLLTAQRALFGPIEFTISLGRDVRSPEELPLAFNTAKEGIYQRLTAGTGRLLSYTPSAPVLQAQQLLTTYIRHIDQAVEALSPEGAAMAAAALEEAGRTPGVGGQELLELVVSAGKSFLLRLHAQNHEQLLRDFTARCDQCTNADALFGCLALLQEAQLAHFLEQRQNDALRPVRMAKLYAQRHFAEPITLEDVCASAGFSASYFSTLFKKETGEGFNKYLTNLRIEQAKELLQQTDAPITDICTQVGYSDLKHFNQTFKKATHLSPGQYRKLYG